MNTIDDLKNYILREYGVSPESFDGKVLAYRAITFERNKGSMIIQNKETNDMWTVRRQGHSIDYYRTEELKMAVDNGGGLLYWFMPEERING